MNHDHSGANSNLHMWIMLACCLVPLGLILAIGVFGISLGSLTPLLPYALILLCPLMMFFMMRGMGHEHGESDAHHAVAPRTLSSAPQTKVFGKPTAEEPSSTGHEHCH